MLLDKAIGNNLICMFVDNGLLRKNEVQEVIDLFKDKINLNLEVVDARKHFIGILKELLTLSKKGKSLAELL